MGCGGSKLGAATSSVHVSYRRLMRKHADAAASKAETSAVPVDVIVEAVPPPLAATAAAAEACDVKDITVNMAGSMVATAEKEGSREEPPPTGGITGTGGAPTTGPPKAGNHEKGGICCAWEGEAHGNMGSDPTKLCNLNDASKSHAHGRGTRDQENSFLPKRDGPVENLRWQLQQLADQLAHNEIWSQEEEEHHDDNRDPMRDVTGRETHGEELFSSKAEEDPKLMKDSLFDDDHFSDAPAVFKEDFSDRIPVYDEDPLDLLQVPRTGCDFSNEGNAITSHLSLDEGEIVVDQIEQVLRQKFVKIRRSKLHGGEGKKERTHYQLHHNKIIRKRRKRRTKIVQ